MRTLFKPFLCICFLGMSLQSFAQDLHLSILVRNADTKEAVSDAHVFIENSTYGVVSDQKGEAKLMLPGSVAGDMFISHISYEAKVINRASYINAKQQLVIELQSDGLEVEELVITAKRSKKWNKQFKRFKKAFLGNDEFAKKCIIKNPEVLRFTEEEGDLTIEASDLIHVVNPMLAYEVYYLLSGMEVSDNGSEEYFGTAYFVDISDETRQSQVDELRKQVYLKSPKCFFRSLVDDRLEERGFKLAMSDYKNGMFEHLAEFNRELHFKASSNAKKFTVEFAGFLEVYNISSREITYNQGGVRPGGLESSRFSGSIREEKAIENFEKSYLYKVSPYIILDAFGNVLNSFDIKEYGHWARQKIAQQLPYNYGDDFEFDDQLLDSGSGLSQKDKYDLLSSMIYLETSEARLGVLDKLKNNWEDGFSAPLIELLRLSSDELLSQAIGQYLSSRYQTDDRGTYYDWLQWLWEMEFEEQDYYFDFKSELYKNVDPKFDKYFRTHKDRSRIRLDEIAWGGVQQDGIPPLRFPELISAEEASYLMDENIIFGFYVNGVAKAYPKRILAWHEFFTDNFGDTQLAGVYCTLCGTVIAYDMDHDGVFHDLGTSGFLYRSNKLMYDKASQSLWSTIDGKPVVGPLADSDIELKTYPVITTSWGEWKERHPDTQVLSLNTGYFRDYGESVAYREYFSHDDLMFPVKLLDKRLNNKDEVVVIRVENFNMDPLAISVDYLKKKKWHQDKINSVNIVAIADESGAVRVYDSAEIEFEKRTKNSLIDNDGTYWSVTEEALRNSAGKELKRVAAHNIFWFAWYNVYPDTRLIY